MIYVVFDSDWVDPPGTVVATYSTRSDAEQYIDQHDGYGYLVLEVPIPTDSAK